MTVSVMVLFNCVTVIGLADLLVYFFAVIVLAREHHVIKISLVFVCLKVP